MNIDAQLTQRELIRKRPAMYVGDVYDGSGLSHMVWEIVGNSVDEWLAGHCTKVAVTLEPDGAITVADDGRGIPVEEWNGEPFAYAALTRMHDAPTMDGHAPHDHLGSRGLGLFVVNALSERLDLHVRRAGGHYTQRYARGEPVSAFERVGPSNETGTRITFLPDPTIFADTWMNAGVIAARLRELACLNPSLELVFSDTRHHRFHEPTGLRALLSRLRGPGGATLGTSLHLDATVDTIRVEVAAEWVSAAWPRRVESFANSNRTTLDGAHVDGLFDGLVAELCSRFPDLCSEQPASILRDVVAAGMHGVVCVRLVDASFDGPTREKLVSPEAKAAVAAAVRPAFAKLLDAEAALEALFRERLGVPLGPLPSSGNSQATSVGT